MRFNKSAIKFDESDHKFNESAKFFKRSTLNLIKSSLIKEVPLEATVCQAVSSSSKSIVSQSVISLISQSAYQKWFISCPEHTNSLCGILDFKVASAKFTPPNPAIFSADFCSDMQNKLPGCVFFDSPR